LCNHGNQSLIWGINLVKRTIRVVIFITIHQIDRHRSGTNAANTALYKWKSILLDISVAVRLGKSPVRLDRMGYYPE
jgi:hypothetical protein